MSFVYFFQMHQPFQKHWMGSSDKIWCSEWVSVCLSVFYHAAAKTAQPRTALFLGICSDDHYPSKTWASQSSGKTGSQAWTWVVQSCPSRKAILLLTPSMFTPKSSKSLIISAQFSKQIFANRKEQQNFTTSISWTYMAAWRSLVNCAHTQFYSSIVHKLKDVAEACSS